MGGTLAAIEAGFIQRQIQESAYLAQVAIDSGEAVVVGVNRFVAGRGQALNLGAGTESRPDRNIFQVDPEVERIQVARVRAVRATRDGAAWSQALAAVSAAAAGRDNLVPAVIAAVEARATVGEISDAMRAVFGEHKETAPL